MQFATLSTLH